MASPEIPATQPTRYFGIEVVDAQTKRGVPLAELKTVSGERFWTDSAGFAAIDEPAFWGRNVYFGVESHGYEFPADGFGNHGVRLDVAPGGSVRLSLRRLNIAERLYRITGEGIYRDSILLGRPAPLREPLLNAQVVGQDSAQAALYQGKAWWFWGDTSRLSYPLGHFGTSGATAAMPGSGGLDPSVGIDLQYFTDAQGFSRPMVPEPPDRLRWIDAVAVLKDGTGAERLVGRVSVMKTLGQCLARRLVLYDDATQSFQPLRELPIDSPLQPVGHPFPVTSNGVHYLYCGDQFPQIRFPATLERFEAVETYEGFTCLAPGARYDKRQTRLERAASGKLVWGWKKNTPPLDREQMAHLVAEGSIAREDVWFQPRDVESGKALTLAAASVSYNAYRQKWISISSEVGGATSMLGETWYSEADLPEGPWVWARKILTHNRYSFYNPVHHAFFDQADGRLIYFEGTYAATFSREGDATPRYDYNQIMYRLDLSDPRLTLKRPD